MNHIRDLFCGLTDDEFAKLVRDVQSGRCSIPIVMEVVSMLSCDLCGAEVADTEAAIEAGWSSHYYFDDHSAAGGDPICLECATQKCYVDSEGELVKKPAAIQPEPMSDYGRYLPPRELFS